MLESFTFFYVKTEIKGGLAEKNVSRRPNTACSWKREGVKNITISHTVWCLVNILVLGTDTK